MSSLNLFGKEWRNIVFEGRNKLYGAYKLREESGKNTLLALAIGLATLSLVFGSSYLYASKSPETIISCPMADTDEPLKVIEYIEKDIPKESVDIPKSDDAKTNDESTAAARTDVQKNIKYNEIIVDKDDLAKDKLAAQSDFDDDTQSGQRDSDADLKDGLLKSDGGVSGDAKEGKDGKVIKKEGGESLEKTNAIMRLVQKKAEPNEGFQKFYDGFTRKFSAHNINSNVNEVVVKLRFVVEKDGSFTDVQILDDKLGFGEEAKRVLRTMPKWKPAEHNGKTVRSMFTLPIKIKVNN